MSVRGRMSLALVLAGIALAWGPRLVLQVKDTLIADRRSAEVARWVSLHPSEGGVRRADRIEPGGEGYLLEIPTIGVRAVVRELEQTVFSGANTPLLKRYGVGQAPYTAALRNVSPGAEGTAVIAGHRTTSGAPFRHLDRLRPRDAIFIRKGAAEQRWIVEDSRIVLPSAVEAIRSEPGKRRLVLVACDPPFSAQRRLIVFALLEETHSRAIAAEGDL